MLMAVIATLTTLASMLLFLASFLMSGAFAGRVPGGSNAVGLVVPLFASILAAVLLLTASAMTLAAHRLDWVAARPGAWVMGLALGTGGAAVALLLAWMEQLGRWVTPVALLAGGVAPLLAGGLLLLSLWAPERLAGDNWPRAAGALLLLSSALGAMTATALLNDWWGLQKDNAARVAATELQEANERARRQRLTPLEQLRENYASYSADTPLWVFVAGLPETDDSAERAFVIDRALQVPNFSQQLERTITDAHPRYRHGAVELMLYVDADKLQAAWAPMLARAIDISAREMAANPRWLKADPMANPNPARHVEAMLAAADRLGPNPQLRAAEGKLQRAVAALSADQAP